MHQLTALGFACLILVSCKESDNNVEPEKKENKESVQLEYLDVASPLLLDITSTGCPGCGSWGKPTFSALAEEHGHEVIPIAVHIKYGDPFITSTSQSIADNRYGSRYTPQIWVNDSNGVILTGSGIDGPASIQRMKKLINDYRQGPLDTLAGAIVDQSANSLSVKVGVKLNENSTSGDYYLGCYLLQDSLLYQQTSSSYNPTVHNFVIRKSLDGAWGKQVTMADSVFEYEGEFTDVSLSSDHHVVVVLWKMENGRYVARGGMRL